MIKATRKHLKEPEDITVLLEEANDRNFAPDVFYRALRETLDASGFHINCNLFIHRIFELKINGALEMFSWQDYQHLLHKIENLKNRDNLPEEKIKERITDQFVRKILGCDLDFLHFIFGHNEREDIKPNYKVDLLISCHRIQDFLSLDLEEFVKYCRPTAKTRAPAEGKALCGQYFPMFTFLSESLLDNEDEILTKDSPFIKYLDSSIWNHLIEVTKDREAPLEPTEESLNSLKIAYEEVFKHYEQNLFGTVNALEFIEFRTRQLCNSYIAGFTRSGSSDPNVEHSLIFPYRFYSRNELKGQFPAFTKKLEGKAWKLLLVDDKAETKLTSMNNRSAVPKKKVILDLMKKEGLVELDINAMLGEGTIEESYLQRYTERKLFEFEDDKIYFHVETADTYNGFIQKLNEGNIYDIILLDQLLDPKKGRGRHRGSDFLLQLLTGKADDKANRYIGTPGPFRYYWIFPVTVFSQAFFDTLQLEGVNYFNNNYRLYRGADPLNEPDLFIYNLLQLMAQQINEAPYVEVENVVAYLSEVWHKTFGVPDNLSESIFDRDNIPDFQDNVRRVYGLFQFKFNDINALRREAKFDEKQDERQGSFLARSLFFQQDYGAVALYDAFRQVLHLVAYGSFQDYVRIHYSLKKARSILKNTKGLYSSHNYPAIEKSIQDFIDFLNENH